MTNYLRIPGILFLAVVALPACAGHHNVQYPNPAFDNAQYDYAKVLRVQPVTEIVQIPEERQVCVEEPVQHHAAGHHSAGPTILGAIIGGVIGSQFGMGTACHYQKSPQTTGPLMLNSRHAFSTAHIDPRRSHAP